MNYKNAITKHADNAHITILEAADELLTAEKEKHIDIINAMQMDNLIASNIEQIADVHRKTFRVIRILMEEALGVHPHYPDTYPKMLLHLRNTYFEEGRI